MKTEALMELYPFEVRTATGRTGLYEQEGHAYARAVNLRYSPRPEHGLITISHRGRVLETMVNIVAEEIIRGKVT